MTPSEEVPPQMPMACALDDGGNTWVRMDRVPGMNIAPPSPIAARAAITRSMCWPIAPTADAVANTTSPARNTRRRPSRSESAPAVRTTPARASE